MWWPFKRKKFCETCGSPMRWNKYLNFYDGKTGEAKYRKSWECSEEPDHTDRGWDW